MSSAGDANSPVSTAKDEADEKADTVEDIGTLPSGKFVLLVRLRLYDSTVIVTCTNLLSCCWRFNLTPVFFQ